MNRSTSKLVLGGLALFLACLLCGCGNKGDLVRPVQDAPGQS